VLNPPWLEKKKPAPLVTPQILPNGCKKKTKKKKNVLYPPAGQMGRGVVGVWFGRFWGGGMVRRKKKPPQKTPPIHCVGGGGPNPPPPLEFPQTLIWVFLVVGGRKENQKPSRCGEKFFFVWCFFFWKKKTGGGWWPPPSPRAKPTHQLVMGGGFF